MFLFKFSYLKNNFQVENLKLSDKVDAAKVMNKFVDEATHGKIKDIIKPDGISDAVCFSYITSPTNRVNPGKGNSHQCGAFPREMAIPLQRP